MRKVYLEGVLGEKFGAEWNLAVNSPAEAMQAIAAQRSGFKQFLIEGENIQGYDVLVGDTPVSTDECLMVNPDMNQSYTFAPVIAGSKNGGILMVLGLALIIMTGGAAAFGMTGMMGSSTVVVGQAAGAAACSINAAMGLAAGSAGAVTASTTVTAAMSVAVQTASMAGTAAGYAVAGAQYLGMGLLLGGASMLLAPDVPDGASAKKAENYLFSGPVNTTKQGQPIPLIYGRMVTGSKTIMGSLFTSSSRSEGAVNNSRKLVGIGGFRNDGDKHGNNAPAGRYTFKWEDDWR